LGRCGIGHAWFAVGIRNLVFDSLDHAPSAGRPVAGVGWASVTKVADGGDVVALEADLRG
jgi:hypothetical protein